MATAANGTMIALPARMWTVYQAIRQYQNSKAGGQGAISLVALFAAKNNILQRKCANRVMKSPERRSVKKQKKINPRKRPATWADVEKAREAGRREAERYTLAIVLTVLYDKESAEKEDVCRVWQEINNLSESIALGYVSMGDLLHVLKTEYEVDIC